MRGLRHVDRQWMNINGRSTTAEFQRDIGDCSKAGKLDEECMRGGVGSLVSRPAPAGVLFDRVHHRLDHGDDQRGQLAALGVAPPRV